MAKAPAVTNNSSLDIWRKVPPEEKLELMARAHAQGVAASLLVLGIAATAAIGLKIPQLFWGAFTAVPFVFQLVSVRAWRGLRPRLILEYLAARSAARRYAFGAHGQDLNSALMFRGELQSEIGDGAPPVEDDLLGVVWRPVWVSLFPDTFVIISEQRGGAKLEVARVLDDRLSAKAIGFEPGDDSRERKVVLSFTGKDGNTWTFSVRSQHNAALLAFERKIHGFIAEQKAELERTKLAYQDLLQGKSQLIEEDDDFGMALPTI